MEMAGSVGPQIFNPLPEESTDIDNIAGHVDRNADVDSIEFLLANLNLNQLPDKFCRTFKNLVKLNLSDNHISELPESIVLLSKLEQFFVDRNDIRQLPEVIGHLGVLKEFSISDNFLSTLPPDISELNRLEILNLSGNKLECLPNSCMKMNHLITLDISRNSFQQIPNCLRQGMLGVQSLNVSNNKHMNVNGAIFSRNLRKFYAKNNGLITTSFPSWILSGRFAEMEELEFEGTQFVSYNIPSSDKTTIRKMNLNNCRLHDTALDKLLMNVSSVEYLDIGNTSCKIVGNSFSIFPSRYIHNPQTTIVFDISSTGIADIPKDIALFHNLTTIDLHGNHLSWLPEEMCTLTELQVLDISSNIIVMLPQNLGSMVSLKIIQAANNNISSLPLSITNLINLEWMDLFGNDFIEVPTEIEVLTNLRALDLEENYFTTDDIVLPIDYVGLRDQLRIEVPNRSIGPKIRETDYESLSPNNSVDEDWNTPDDTASVQDDSYDVNQMIEEENWDKSADSAEEFDPFDPPPISPPKWEIPQVVFENLFNFCPADLHARRIKDVIAEARANGQCSSLPFVEGQFDDIE